ncbi:MAG: hypothetical protein AB7S26_10555 [Sandaracinaceae bacterium]
MAEPKGPKVPVLSGLFAARATDGPPTLDRARETLGGPWVGGPEIGDVVRIHDRERLGVVVHADLTHRDVWIGSGRIQRVRADEVEVAPRPSLDPLEESRDRAEAELDAVLADVRIFASLENGAPVTYQDREGRAHGGTLVEKLRFGALVGTPDQRIVAVSFRRVAPNPPDAPDA